MVVRVEFEEDDEKEEERLLDKMVCGNELRNETACDWMMKEEGFEEGFEFVAYSGSDRREDRKSKSPCFHVLD